MAMRQAAPNRFREIMAWCLSIAALSAAVGVRLSSGLLFDELVSQGSLQASVSQLPSLRFLRLQIQLAEQREFYDQQAIVIDSPLVALAYVNRWVSEEAVPEHQRESEYRREMVRAVCEAFREEELPERYRMFCLAKLSKSSDTDLKMLANELSERWKGGSDLQGQALSRRQSIRKPRSDRDATN